MIRLNFIGAPVKQKKEFSIILFSKQWHFCEIEIMGSGVYTPAPKMWICNDLSKCKNSDEIVT